MAAPARPSRAGRRRTGPWQRQPASAELDLPPCGAYLDPFSWPAPQPPGEGRMREAACPRPPVPGPPYARHAWPMCSPAGRGSRLWTHDRRAKPAVFFGGKSRFIDFALSNAIISGIRASPSRAVQGAFADRHSSAAGFPRPERNETFDYLPAASAWTSAMVSRLRIAVFRPRHHEDYGPRYVLWRAHIYKMDLEVAAQHVETGADVTVGCFTVPRMVSERLRRDACRCREQHHRFLREARDPPGSRRAASRPRLDVHYVFDLRLPPTAPPRCRRPQLQPRFRQGISRCREARAAGGAPLRGILRAVRAEAAPYWRVVGTVDAIGGQCRSHRRGARPRPLRPPGRSGRMRRSPAASCP